MLEAGDYVLKLGTSSRNTTPAAVMEARKEITAAVCRNICRREHTVREIEPPMNMDTCEYQDGELERYIIEDDAVETVTYSYEEKADALFPYTRKLLEKLTGEELCEPGVR